MIVLFKAQLSTHLGISAAWVQSMRAASIPVLCLVLRDGSSSSPKVLGWAGMMGMAILLLYSCYDFSRPLSCKTAWVFFPSKGIVLFCPSSVIMHTFANVYSSWAAAGITVMMPYWGSNASWNGFSRVSVQWEASCLRGCWAVRVSHCSGNYYYKQIWEVIRAWCFLLMF